MRTLRAHDPSAPLPCPVSTIRSQRKIRQTSAHFLQRQAGMAALRNPLPQSRAHAKREWFAFLLCFTLFFPVLQHQENTAFLPHRNSIPYAETPVTYAYTLQTAPTRRVIGSCFCFSPRHPCAILTGARALCRNAPLAVDRLLQNRSAAREVGGVCMCICVQCASVCGYMHAPTFYRYSRKGTRQRQDDKEETSLACLAKRQIDKQKQPIFCQSAS